MGNRCSILPWDNWIYHVDSKKHEVNTLHAQAVVLQDSINAQARHYNTLLDQVKQLLSGNSALVIIIKGLRFDDVQLKNFDAHLQPLPNPPKGCVPAKFAGFLTEVTGSILILKAVVNLVTLVRSAAFEAAEGGQAAGEVGVEGLAEAGLEVAEGGEVAGEVGLEGLLKQASKLVSKLMSKPLSRVCWPRQALGSSLLLDWMLSSGQSMAPRRRMSSTIRSQS